jgi:site-specific DNA recombinase
MNRRELLEADLKRVESEVDTGARRRIKSLEKAIGQLKARQDRLVRNLELDDDTDGVTFRRIRERMDELENERLRKLKDLHALRGEEPDADPASPDLLDQLPVGDVNLSSAPEHMLRRMFESFRLQVRYDKVASWATCRVAIREETLDQLLTDSSALSQRKRTIQTESVPFWLVPPVGFERKGRQSPVQICARYGLAS